MQDPEYAEMVVKSQERAAAEGKPAPSSAPPLSTWSSEMEMLATIVDKLSAISYVLRVSNGDKRARPPKPFPRPETVLPQVRQRKRREQHEALAAKLLRR
jgi:hypothetical protein